MKLYFTLNFWKDLWIWLNLLIKSFCLCPLICSFLTLQIYFIRFSMNVYTSITTFTFLIEVWWAQTRITLQRTAYLYAEHWSASGLIPRLFVAWWAQVDSNHRPRAYQARALTTWAMSPFSFSMYLVYSRLRLFCRWWRWWESNPWPPACRAGALPAELHPHFMRYSFF